MAEGLRPFFCFYGSKWRAAPRYPKPEQETIVEPFAGAAGYATRFAERNIILVEKDPVIASLWRYLTKVKSNEISALPTAVPTTVDELPICQEARWLIGFWCNKGAAGPMKSPSAWMRSGVRPKSYWGKEVRDIIASQVEAIHHWKIIEGSYETSPDIEATWFIDPPYQHAGKHYRHSTVDYPKLAEWSKKRQGLTIVCEHDGANWLPFSTFANIKSNPSKRGKGKSLEAIFMQGSKEKENV